jgi:hypothetical protein
VDPTQLSGANLAAFRSGNILHNQQSIEDPLGHFSEEQKEQLSVAVKDKEQELKRKLLVKQNLKKIQDGVDDHRFKNLEEYIRTLTKIQEDFYRDPLSKHINIKTVILQNKQLSR